MPPLPEDEDSGSGEDIPFKKVVKGGAVEESEGEEDEEEFVIEKIVKHDWDSEGTVIYNVKWEDYENEEDMTWEPESNLASATETLNAYWATLKGGKPEPKPPEGGSSKKRKADSTPKGTQKIKRGRSETPELLARKSKGNDFKPPKGSWEKDVASIDTIEEVVDDKGVLQRFVYVLWESGEKTRHNLRTVNEKCPQMMLRYYENHLVFRSAEGDANGAV